MMHLSFETLTSRFHFAYEFETLEYSHTFYTPWSVLQDGSIVNILPTSRDKKNGCYTICHTALSIKFLALFLLSRLHRSITVLFAKRPTFSGNLYKEIQKAMLTGPSGKVSPGKPRPNFQTTTHYLQSLPF